MGWNPKYALLLFFSTAITFFASYLIERLKDKRKLVLIIALVLILLVLIYYKYLNFILSLAVQILSVFHIRLSVPHFDIILPVGISFFTFQAAGYLIDVYRGEIKAERNFLRYALFVSFFPQLVAGPIERSRNLLGQFEETYSFDFDRAKNGFLLMLWGLFLKMVIADRAAIFVDAAYESYQNCNGLILMFATILFAFQIYCDFYGYSIIAKGAAQILGIELMDNFCAPYFSTSIQDFWRRWHISLSTWFRDYIYIPLGGSRCSAFRRNLNIMIVMTISGIWHGAGLHYVVWGIFHGILQVSERLTKSVLEKIPKCIRWFGTFFWVTVAWVFFRANSLTASFKMLKKMASAVKNAILHGEIFSSAELFQVGATDHTFSLQWGFSSKDLRLLFFSIIALLVADFFKYKGISLSQKFCNQKPALQVLEFALIITFLSIFGIWGTAFNAANFIYFQF